MLCRIILTVHHCSYHETLRHHIYTEPLRAMSSCSVPCHSLFLDSPESVAVSHGLILHFATIAADTHCFHALAVCKWLNPLSSLVPSFWKYRSMVGIFF